MELQNKLIIRKRISEKGPYIEGIELTFKDIIKLLIRCIKGNKINIFVFDENDADLPTLKHVIEYSVLS